MYFYISDIINCILISFLYFTCDNLILSKPSTIALLSMKKDEIKYKI